MTWSWFDLAWPWIGAVAAAVLLVLLFGTQKLRGTPSRSRWRDPVWLSWLAAVIYMLHNIEEYGIDLLGRTHAFPDSMCTTLGLPAYPACPLPPAFYLAVNLSIIWVAAPVAALLSRRHRLVGFSLYGVIIINGMIHIAPTILGRGYDPGFLTAVLLFFPSFFWIARTSFGPGRIPYPALAAIVATGVLVHVILIASALLFIRGVFGDQVLLALQILNAGVLLLIPYLAERRLGLAPLARNSVATA